MGLDMWFREDVVRTLASAQVTINSVSRALPALDQEMAAAYRRGFDDALQAVAVAFGIVPPKPEPEPPQFTVLGEGLRQVRR
jgi:hypothetical protein